MGAAVKTLREDPGRGEDPGRDEDPGRHETPEERYDRNFGEILQELRVAAIGVQVLFAFLLTMPFTNRFGSLDGAQRALYTATLLISALAIAFLVTPVAFHRVEFRRHRKGAIVAFANVMAIAGLVCVAFAITGAVCLVMTVAEDGPLIPIAVGGLALVFTGLWLVLPLASRQRRRRRPPA
jgi:hypothetical protein